jgi:2-dehydro-3-deoxyphosphooctonate aldolase (KDO 8-P synthase)
LRRRWSIFPEGNTDGAGASGTGARPLLIIGPCGIESREICLRVAEASALVAGALPIPVEWIFKSSFLKDNRTSAGAWSGPGPEEGLRVLEEIRREFGVRTLTDIHLPEHAAMAAGVVDVLQVPAFLCRQTSLLSAAGAASTVVNIKKGQFMDPGNMRGSVAKVRSAGRGLEVWLTERGSFFGYGDLVVDFRSLRVMAGLADRVILDVTHSLQKPGAAGGRSGGDRGFALFLARAGAAWGVDGLFIEAHPDPASALSDSDTMLDFPMLAEVVNGAFRHWEGVAGRE